LKKIVIFAIWSRANEILPIKIYAISCFNKNPILRIFSKLDEKSLSFLLGVGFMAGSPDWENFRPMGECLLWAVF
jgi:hypothetical protein